MTTYLRQSDYVFRIGGEEFVLLLTSTAAENASTLVAKMRAGITETRTGDDVESIYERADKALYKAKNSGRDCQFIAD